MIRVAICIIGLYLCGAFNAFAQQPDQAELDKAIAEIDTARAAVTEALSKAPLGFRRILFVEGVPEGFADYKPRANNQFSPDEPLIVYSEPIGVAWKNDGDEYSSQLVVDFEIRSPEGQVLASQKGFGEFALSAREPPLDFMTHIKLDVTGAPAGSYILSLTVHDSNSGKSASTDLPFEIK